MTIRKPKRQMDKLAQEIRDAVNYIWWNGDEDIRHQLKLVLRNARDQLHRKKRLATLRKTR